MAEGSAPEHQDRGLFGIFGKKKEEESHPQGHGDAGEVHHVAAAPPAHHQPEQHGEGEKKQHEGLKGKLHRSHSSSSSSSSDEEEGGGKKEGGKKKKGLKEKIKGKKEGEKQHGEDGEKKGLMEKIKEKLPGHHGQE
uniref:Dehydrin n=1 Tax=Araucaria cunninghamii TaxID=56994 RepID=A0A0D6QV54_ARACU